MGYGFLGCPFMGVLWVFWGILCQNMGVLWVFSMRGLTINTREIMFIIMIEWNIIHQNLGRGVKFEVGQVGQ